MGQLRKTKILFLTILKSENESIFKIRWIYYYVLINFIILIIIIWNDTTFANE